MFFGICNGVPTQDSSYSYSGSYGITAAQYVGRGGSLTNDTTAPRVSTGNTLVCVLDLNAFTFSISVVETAQKYVISSIPAGQSWHFMVNLYGPNDQVTFL
eukprot:TRINITY_DN55667_c0_g1_i1.p1 TRINITY_DN55667_c0_g1~~TRINITY_DN55667_c0_g1_i1.p1  ORF type:complete len:101 (-),score=11.35 TRINITY_DN55667_c0_g1_i1:2-304(-)